MDILKYCIDLDNMMSDAPKKKLLKESKTLKAHRKPRINENFGHDGYMYLTKHGMGPGTLPKDVKVLKWKDLPHFMTAIWTDRFLTTDELKQFDIFPETEIERVMDFYDISEKDLLEESLTESNQYGMKNIEIEVVDDNYIVVYADTDRFGKHEVMGEFNTFRDAFNYIKRELGCDELKYDTMIAVGAYKDRNGETHPVDMWNVRPAKGSVRESLKESVEYLDKVTVELEEPFGTAAFAVDGSNLWKKYGFYQDEIIFEDDDSQKRLKELNIKPGDKFIVGIRKATPEEKEYYNSDVMVDILSKLNESLRESKDRWVQTPYGFKELNYKGMTITDYKGCEIMTMPYRYTVDYYGDEAGFDSLEDAKKDIDEFLNESFKKRNKKTLKESESDLFDNLVQIMDDDIREQVHADLAPCTKEEFLAEYARRHEEKFGEPFPPKAW